VVIGAGILGAAVAARLAEAGLQVTLLDQDHPGQATSRWSFAWINSNDKAPRPITISTTPGCVRGPSWPLTSTATPGTGPSATSSWPPRVPANSKPACDA